MSATAEDRVLHSRLIDGDPTSSAVIFDRFLTPLIAALKRSFPKVDDARIWDVATTAIFDYHESPQRYDPDRLTILGYLRMDAAGNLKNTLKREKRTEASENILQLVELRQGQRNIIESPPEADQLVIDHELLDKLDDLVPDPIERCVLDLMMERERETRVFAEAMGIAHLSDEEQHAQVKRMKDKLKARLRREGRDSFI